MPLSGSLSFYLKMDETGTGTRADSTGNGIDFTNNNSATNGTGKVNNGTVLVRSSSQSLSRADEAAISCTGDWVISLWMKFDVLTNYNLIWHKGNGSEAWIYTQANGSLVLEVGCYYAAYNSAAKAAGSLTTGVWYHILAWRNASTGEIGLCLNNDTPTTSTVAGTINASATGMAIGSHSGAHYCDATVDEVAFGQFVPTANDRKLFYGAGSPGSLEQLIADFPDGCTAYYKLEDETEEVAGLDLTNTNSTPFTTGALNNCADFSGNSSGSNRKLSRASDSALQHATKWSLSLWYNSPYAEGSGGTWIGKGVYPSPGYEWAVRPWNGSSLGVYVSSTGTDFPYGSFYMGTDYLNNTGWHHMVAIYDGGAATDALRLRVWSDGVEITGSYTGTIPSTMFTSSGALELPMFGSLMGLSYIKLDEFGFWAGTVLTGTDVANLYNSGTPLAFPAVVYAGHYYQNFTVYRVHLRR